MCLRHLKYWSQIALLCCGTPALGNPLFESHEPLDVELRGPLAATTGDLEDREERSFKLTAQGAALDVAVRVRGNNRVDVCRFPPLRLNFRTRTTQDTVFEGQDKLKLVTHCKGAAGYQNNVLDEYLAYRIFGLLSATSHRVRLLRITYIDSDNPGSGPVTRFGFVIESAESLAARVNGQIANVPTVRKSQLDKPQSALVFLFHYLIANRDWALGRSENKDSCCHNGNLIDIDGRLHLVPFDFDRSGLVNARYASAGENQRPVRVRVYRGYCIRDLDLDAAAAAIAAREADIMGLIDALPELSKKDTRARQRFLQEFFDTANEDPGFASKLAERCIG